MKKAEWASVLASLERGDWQAAHEIVQKHEDDALACWAHGIVHRMEGDDGNARYWYRLADRPYSTRTTIPEEIEALGSSIAAGNRSGR